MIMPARRGCEVRHLELESTVVEGRRGLELLVQGSRFLTDPEHLARRGREEPGSASGSASRAPR